PFGRLDLILPVERLRTGQRHGEAEAQRVLRQRGMCHAERRGQAGGSHKQTPRGVNEVTHGRLLLVEKRHAAARSSACSAASAVSVLITSAYFSDMSNRLTACDTWLRS